jgi:hypothetical protein
MHILKNTEADPRSFALLESSCLSIPTLSTVASTAVKMKTALIFKVSSILESL